MWRSPGPDICGPGTKKVHVIFNYKGKNHLINKDVRCKVWPTSLVVCWCFICAVLPWINKTLRTCQIMYKYKMNHQSNDMSTYISVCFCRTTSTPTCTHWSSTLTTPTRSRSITWRLSLETWRTTGTSCLPKKLRIQRPKNQRTGLTRRRFQILKIRNQRSVSFGASVWNFWPPF